MVQGAIALRNRGQVLVSRWLSLSRTRGLSLHAHARKQEHFSRCFALFLRFVSYSNPLSQSHSPAHSCGCAFSLPHTHTQDAAGNSEDATDTGKTVLSTLGDPKIRKYLPQGIKIIISLASLKLIPCLFITIIANTT